jgi:predicted permease
MISVLAAIAPIFGLLVIGQLLFRLSLFPDEFWQMSTRLVYWVLLPALLFSKLGTAQFEGDLVLPFAAALIGGFLAVVCYVMLVGRLFNLRKPVISSVLQGAARHNIFIALALAEWMLGVDGLALASLAASILVIVTNLTITPMMVGLAHEGGQDKIWHAIFRDLCRNPIIVAVFAGLIVNALNVGSLTLVFDLAGLLGNAALPLMLLCVGASLRFSSFHVSFGALVLATIGKLIVFPSVVLLIATTVDLSDAQTMVVLIFASVPTAASAQALARELGGDVPLMVNVVSFQTALTFLSLPLTLWLVKNHVALSSLALFSP